MRQEDLPRLFPVFARNRWLDLITAGVVPSRRIGRAVIVSRPDVVAFLAGTQPAGVAR